eukprot:5295124-Pleurochrysis_carterae.AAC.5
MVIGIWHVEHLLLLKGPADQTLVPRNVDWCSIISHLRPAAPTVSYKESALIQAAIRHRKRSVAACSAVAPLPVAVIQKSAARLRPQLLLIAIDEKERRALHLQRRRQN